MSAASALMLVVGLVVGLGACSSDDDSSDDTAAEASDAEQACAAWADVQAAVTAVADVDVVADGTDALRSTLDDLVSRQAAPPRNHCRHGAGLRMTPLAALIRH